MKGQERFRRRLLEIYAAALEAVGGRRCVAAALAGQSWRGRPRLVAVGKAAAAMAEGALECLGEDLAGGLLIGKAGHLPSYPLSGVLCLEGGHPLPDAASLEAGQRLLDFIDTAPADTHWLFLISGGSSSLVEVLPPGLGLTELRRFNQWLLASGLPIEVINPLRRRLSLIKGGRLARRLGGAPAEVLLISDVPGDQPALIGSGPLAPPAAGEDGLPQALPDWLRPWLDRAPPSPAADDPCFRDTRHRIVANLDQALEAAARAACQAGQTVHRHASRLAGEAEAVGRELARRLAAAAPGIHLWGGEVTVTLPPAPGQGGRCQQLALAAARELAGRDDVWLLAAGSDGGDGPGDVAGALVDGATLARGQAEGLDAGLALAGADAGSFLAAAGDLIDTGPTGTNVTDLVIACKRSPQQGGDE
ncbi:DUF4147 domain-containing protein [Thiohalobacter sp. IOR34]|uniref:DUF4147 domain-containing protein n=1 Tax=Thiohalobacter sp. IOR34 TaxID=3057176 RepID=UPI0025B19910|nr:DUF4147 domain-containing protein [Thiohalobacter sp. IOR34]WJW74507.1 DUF4147 domain-containing protein [Thiohalobacter sp. IOR34]